MLVLVDNTLARFNTTKRDTASQRTEALEDNVVNLSILGSDNNNR